MGTDFRDGEFAFGSLDFSCVVFSDNHFIVIDITLAVDAMGGRQNPILVEKSRSARVIPRVVCPLSLE